MEQNFTQRSTEFSLIITLFPAAAFQFSFYLRRKTTLITLDLLVCILAVVTLYAILGPPLQVLLRVVVIRSCSLLLSWLIELLRVEF